MAAVLASGHEAVLSHWSAAAHWMIRPSSRSTVDVTTPRKSRTWDGIKRHHKALPVDEITVEEGIPVTTVPRTIFDLAATEAADVVESLLREMEYRELRDRLSLWDLVHRYPGRSGVRRVRVALERLEEEPEGYRRRGLEERFAPFLRRHRLPLPRFNDWIFVAGKRYQVDCHWPGSGQIVELDGWDGHSTRTAFREDRARDRRLRAAGYSVTRASPGTSWTMNRRRLPQTSGRCWGLLSGGRYETPLTGSTRKAERNGFAGLKKVAVCVLTRHGYGSWPSGPPRNLVKRIEARRQGIADFAGM
jgi:very-short-patch-repair endonuclease